MKQIAGHSVSRFNRSGKLNSKLGGRRSMGYSARQPRMHQVKRVISWVIWICGGRRGGPRRKQIRHRLGIDAADISNRNLHITPPSSGYRWFNRWCPSCFNEYCSQHAYSNSAFEAVVTGVDTSSPHTKTNLYSEISYKQRLYAKDSPIPD